MLLSSLCCPERSQPAAGSWVFADAAEKHIELDENETSGLSFGTSTKAQSERKIKTQLGHKNQNSRKFSRKIKILNEKLCRSTFFR